MVGFPKESETERHRDVFLKQIGLGIIVCPETKNKLNFENSDLLITENGDRVYPVLNAQIPVLVIDSATIEKYAESSKNMNEEYTVEHLEYQKKWFNKVRGEDYRTKESIRAENSIFANLDKNSVCLSIGGGPARAHEYLVNLNIAPFPNVDIVGDAHQLPYADNTVDAIFCEAVFEHLHSPSLAAHEVYRVLKKGGKAFVCTPFLQTYHGYPHHYQNFTLTGHIDLFEKEGLRILNSGTCVGPTFVLRNMVSIYITNYIPFPINKILKIIWAAISIAIAPLDIFIGRRDNSHEMASTTFLVAVKS